MIRQGLFIWKFCRKASKGTPFPRRSHPQPTKKDSQFKWKQEVQSPKSIIIFREGLPSKKQPFSLTTEPNPKPIRSPKQSEYKPEHVQRTIVTSSDLLGHHRKEDTEDLFSSSELESEYFEDDSESKKLSSVEKMKRNILSMEERLAKKREGRK